MYKILYITILLFIHQLLFAQNNLSGIVKDKKSGEVIPGVNVYIPELQRGTITDENGYFQLNKLPEGQFKVQFSFLGYAKEIRTINLPANDLNLNVQLQEESILAEEIVVSGGSYSSQHENAIKIESLKAEALKLANTTSFIQAIAQTPGVDLISKGPGIATPVIRGLSLSNVLMLNNGVRMENFQFSENHPFMVNESGVDRVEIIKGPASLLYGSDAVGGVINIIDEKPVLAGTFNADAGINYYANTKGINADLGLKATTKNNWFWIVRSGIKRHADYLQANEEQVPNSRFNTTFVKVNTGINRTYGKFAVRYNFDRMKLGLTIPPAINLNHDNTNNNEFWFQDLSNHFIASNNTLFLNNVKIDFNLAFQQNNRKLQGDENNPFFTMVNMKLNTFNTELKSYFNINPKSEIIFGLHSMYQDNKNETAPQHVLPDYKLNDFSLYSLWKNKRSENLTLQLGFRYDLRFINIPEQLKSGEPTESEYLNKLNTNYGNLNGSLGATYRIKERILFRANIASAYRTPNIAELTQNGMHGNRFEQGNRDLIPQKSIESDLSLHYHAQHFIYDLAGFYNQINNYIYLSPTNDTSTNGARIYRYAQNNASIYGFETGIEYRKHPFSVKISYSYLRGEQKNGENLPFIPQNKLNTNFYFHQKQLAFLHEIKFNISGVYAFAQNNPAMFETNTEAYFVFNSSFDFNLPVKNQNITFNLFVNNIFDVAYYDHLSTLKEIGYYNTGRNFGIGIRYLFKN